MQNKRHDHVQKMRASRKGRTRGELTITLIRWTLIRRRNKLIFRHSLKTITTRVVRMLYLRDMEHIGYNIWCDNNARNSNASNKKKYWKIKSMHIGVELLDQHGWTCDRDVTQWPPFPTMDDSGKVSVRKVRQNDLAFRMNASSRELLKEVQFGLLIMEPDRKRCRIRRSGCLGMKKVSRRSRFVFGCHRSRLMQTEEREGERDNQKSPKQKKYIKI